MLEFENLSLSHGDFVRPFLEKGRTGLCDPTMGGVMMWRNHFHTQLAYDGDCLYFRCPISSEHLVYTPPIGDLAHGVEAIVAQETASGRDAVFFSVGEEDRASILALLPDYVAEPQRDSFDYVYLKEKMISFSGKKLSGQRNHRNYFLNHFPNWHFEEITADNLPLAKELFAQVLSEQPKEDPSFLSEKEAVLEVMDHPEVYRFFGGMVFAEEKPVAFSYGEIIGDMMFVHIEKALRSVRGAYQMMTSSFLSRFAREDTVYVNREEDMGDPGLRYSKTAYHPEMMLKKYVLHKK